MRHDAVVPNFACWCQLVRTILLGGVAVRLTMRLTVLLNVIWTIPKLCAASINCSLTSLLKLCAASINCSLTSLPKLCSAPSNCSLTSVLSGPCVRSLGLATNVEMWTVEELKWDDSEILFSVHQLQLTNFLSGQCVQAPGLAINVGCGRCRGMPGLQPMWLWKVPTLCLLNVV